MNVQASGLGFMNLKIDRSLIPSPPPHDIPHHRQPDVGSGRLQTFRIQEVPFRKELCEKTNVGVQAGDLGGHGGADVKTIKLADFSLKLHANSYL
jgi:hypothetical protein